MKFLETQKKAKKKSVRLSSSDISKCVCLIQNYFCPFTSLYLKYDLPNSVLTLRGHLNFKGRGDFYFSAENKFHRILSPCFSFSLYTFSFNHIIIIIIRDKLFIRELHEQIA